MAISIKKNGNGHNGNGRNGNGHNGNGSFLKIAVLIAALLLATFLGYRQVDRWLGSGESVWVATAGLAPGSLVGEGDLERMRMRTGEVPDGAIADRGRIEGQRLSRAKQEGDAFVASDFEQRRQQNERPPLAELLPEGRVMTEVPLWAENVLFKEMRRGDRIDILASGRSREGRGVSRTVARDVYFIGFVDPNLLRETTQPSNGNGERQGLLEALISSSGVGRGTGPVLTTVTNALVGLYPGDVFPVTEARAQGLSLSLVLHGRHEVEKGELLTFNGQRDSWLVEYITGSTRGRVEFVQ
jgi:hypothetical protein